MNYFLRFLFLVTIIFSGCLLPSSKKKKEELPQNLPYTVVSRSPHFNKKNITFKLDTVNHFLNVRLNLEKMKDLPFPVVEKDTLRATAFHFDFYYKNQLLSSDYNIYQSAVQVRNHRIIDSTHLCFSGDTIYLSNSNELIFQIPFYAFHKLKQGKQTIELHMWQDTFRGDAYDSIYNKVKTRYCNYAQKIILEAKVQFEIDVPRIYKSTIIGYGLQLKNDSTFSPIGMDNTIWNSSYPDIYWTLSYPTGRFYAQTDYEKSTDKYEGSDTFDLYHYYLKDSIQIEVFDHDGLSRDDGMGYWIGPMDFLRREPRRRFSFGNIAWFDINIGQAKVVN